MLYVVSGQVSSRFSVVNVVCYDCLQDDGFNVLAEILTGSLTVNWHLARNSLVIFLIFLYVVVL